MMQKIIQPHRKITTIAQWTLVIQNMLVIISYIILTDRMKKFGAWVRKLYLSINNYLFI